MKIQLPLIQETPLKLNSLVDYHGGPLSTYFRENIYAFNSMFAFTSFRANIDSTAKNSYGSHIFKISGQIHQLMGSLLPTGNNPPKFAQLYIYDTKNKIKNRISTFLFDDASKNLTRLIVKILVQMLDETNKLLKLF